jgi:hypothetical protein
MWNLVGSVGKLERERQKSVAIVNTIQNLQNAGNVYENEHCQAKSKETRNKNGQLGGKQNER